MLFWTPDITNYFYSCFKSTTTQIVCCEENSWNGIGSLEFERRISYSGLYKCIPLIVHGDQVGNVIKNIWQHVASNKILVDEFIENTYKFRVSEIRQQVNSGTLPDLGIYDCADLLAKIESDILLCLRIVDSIPSYLMPWLDYILNYTKVKIIIIYPSRELNFSKFKHIDNITLPVISKYIIIEKCQNAVHRLTGSYIETSEIEIAFSYSQSLNEFVSLVQAATVSQCTISELLSLQQEGLG